MEECSESPEFSENKEEKQIRLKAEDIDLSGRVCFMYNALHEHAKRTSISFGDASNILNTAMNNLLNQSTLQVNKNKLVALSHDDVLRFMDDDETRRNFIKDGNFQRHVYDQLSSSDITVEEKVVLAHLEWMKLVRKRAECLGYYDSYTDSLEFRQLLSCFKCGKENAKKRCSHCHSAETSFVIRYCNQECQKTDWDEHRILCAKKKPELSHTNKGQRNQTTKERPNMCS